MLRVLSKADILPLVKIEKLTQSTPWTQEIFEQCLQIGYLGWVTESEGEVTGFVIISRAAGEMHILNLGVHPDFQRRGLGEALMRTAIAIAKANHFHQAILEVRRSNKKAIALYEKLDFIQIGERKNYYPAPNPEDALVFAKDLTL